jgi:hypothetical protein
MAQNTPLPQPTSVKVKLMDSTPGREVFSYTVGFERGSVVHIHERRNGEPDAAAIVEHCQVVRAVQQASGQKYVGDGRLLSASNLPDELDRAGVSPTSELPF